MGAGLLPWERIPIFIWGAVLILIGLFLLSHEELISWGEARAVLVLAAGLAAFIYDVRKRRSAKLKDESKLDKESM
jgi:hypothetical protein